MKNRTIRNTTLAAATAVMALTACSKSSDNSDITGSWSWVSRNGGIGGNTNETPASTGKNITLVLGTDSKYSIWENGVIISQGTYTRSTGTCIHDQGIKTTLDFSGAPDMMVESFNGNTLVLSDEANDGLNSTYRR